MDFPSSVYALAILVQFIIGTFIFGTVYAAILYAFGWPSTWLICGVIGLVHGILVGLSLPIIERFDPGIKRGHSPRPGLFAKNFGAIAPVGLVAAHVLYGIIFGLLYTGGQTFRLFDAHIAAFVGTLGLTLFILAGKVLKISKTDQLDLIASSISTSLRFDRRPRRQRFAANHR